MRRFYCLLTVVALNSALVGSACGASEAGVDVPANGSAAEASPSTGRNDAGTSTTARAASKGGSDVAAAVCETIRSVQGDLLADAVSAAYLAQFTIRLDASLYNEDLDAAAKQGCLADYERFLQQADIASFKEL